MTRPRLPLTPSSSTEIAAMDKRRSPAELYFALPPAAVSISPATKKRSASDIDLPPPPTRTRKIIQMKPKTQDLENESKTSPAKSRDTSSKKKQNGAATTAAGRKIARKTAHSLIERRRRSKMNEEFSTLKDMIPACHGQEMHKLAILQASIEYMNYLEQCITDLKDANKRKDSPSLPEWTGPNRVEDSPSTSASVSPTIPQQFQFTPPEIPQRHTFDIIPMVLPSPSLPQGSSPSTTTSPVLLPQNQSPNQQPPPSSLMDHEASAALLMLNSHDRRESTVTVPQPAPERKLGISVHDLLT